jgi:hypothetical protein
MNLTGGRGSFLLGGEIFLIMNIVIFRCGFVSWSVCLMTGWAQVSDDFEDGNDEGWTRLNPLAAFGGTAAYSFPGGDSYRFQVGASPNAAVGKARGGALRADIDHTAFRVSVDIVAWDSGLAQDFGILARVSSPGLGTLNGYAATFDTTNEGAAFLSRVDGEQPANLGNVDLPLDAAKDYRMVFHGYEGQFLIEVFDMADLTTTIGTVAGFDEGYAGGSAGLFGSAGPEDGTVDVTFDNFDSGVNPDTDQDGMSDPAEASIFGNLAQDGAGDFDGDGRSNAVELREGTDPKVRDTAFEVRSFFIDEDVMVVSFLYIEGVTYQLETSVDLETWTVDEDASFSRVGGGMGEFESDRSGEKEFVRVRVSE